MAYSPVTPAERQNATLELRIVEGHCSTCRRETPHQITTRYALPRTYVSSHDMRVPTALELRTNAPLKLYAYDNVTPRVPIDIKVCLTCQTQYQQRARARMIG